MVKKAFKSVSYSGYGISFHRTIYTTPPRPMVSKCCNCVTDLKTAVAIIAALAIVTSPSVSWTIVRHSYVIRVSCYITSHEDKRDVIDLHLNNALSFGFGVNAGLGPSCTNPKKNATTESSPKVPDSSFYMSVRWIGWIVLLTDLIFLVYSITFLYRLFQPKSPSYQYNLTAQYMWVCMVSILLAFIYSMLYVVNCIIIGGVFPIFEFFFAVFDLMVWGYFLIVINSYSGGTSASPATGSR